MGKFSGQVGAFNKKFEARYRSVARTAVQETVAMAQHRSKEGGRMRVKTGFLRASIQAGIGAMPSGPTVNEGDKRYAIGSQVAGAPVSVTLLKWDPNTPVHLFVGWTANYARPREAQDGFLRGAVEVWDQTVERVAKRVSAGLG